MVRRSQFAATAGSELLENVRQVDFDRGLTDRSLFATSLLPSPAAAYRNTSRSRGHSAVPPSAISAAARFSLVRSGCGSTLRR